MKKFEINPSDYKILVVDDIATNVLLIKAVLSRVKYNIVTASNGAEALDVVARENPDLILLDIMMPGMNGYEVLQQLRKDERFAQTPVIFLTALQSPQDLVKGFKLGADDYITKPFYNEELLTRVAHHIMITASQRELEKQHHELQRTISNRDQMYSVIAHDLRSPIGTLKMVFNMLSMNLTEDKVGRENLEMLNMGNDIVENTFMLLDNLLKWTKSQTGRMKTVFQTVNLSEVVLFAGKISDLVAQAKNIRIEYRLPGPVQVRCDVDMVKTIMRNLLSNAIKFSHEGGTIIVSLEEMPTCTLVHVRDFGKGIRPEDLPKVLDAERHYTTYGTRNEEGSGLGLQLCQDLVRRNGGEMQVESVYGEGSTFTFSIAKFQVETETQPDQQRTPPVS